MNPEPQMSQDNWWYQYPTGQWVWWSAERNEWIPVQPAQPVQSARTPWWVYVLIVVAAVVMIGFFIALINQLPEIIQEQQRLQNQVNV